jgi:hypothetical protein
MKIKTIWVLVLSLVIGAAYSAAPVRADVTMGVTPSLVELSGKDGSTGEIELTVLNQGDEAFDATLTTQQYNRADLSLSVPDWLTVEPASVQVEPGGQATVTVSIAIPEGEPSGSRYAGVAITSGSVQEEGSGATVAGELVVPFLITVEGEGKLERKAEIERFAPVIELDGRLGFRTLVHNAGNIDWQASGKAIVNKADGSDYGNLDFAQSRVYPQGSTLLTTTSTLPVEAGAEFSTIAEIEYGADDPVEAETEFTFTPELAVTGSACENLDRGPTMTATLDNSGDLGIMTNLTMTIAGADGQAIARANAPAADIAWPNETTSIPVDLLDRLPTGDYTLTIDVQTGASAEPMTQTIPFSIGGTGPNVAPICEQPTESTPDAG